MNKMKVSCLVTNKFVVRNFLFFTSYYGCFKVKPNQEIEEGENFRVEMPVHQFEDIEVGETLEITFWETRRGTWTPDKRNL